MAKTDVATPGTNYLPMQGYRTVVRNVPIFKPKHMDF
jgi:hypothetical protein